MGKGVVGDQPCRNGSGGAHQQQLSVSPSRESLGSQEGKRHPGMHQTLCSTSQTKEVIILLHSALVWPHLKYSEQFRGPQIKKDVKVLEYIQRATTKLEGRSYKDWLRRLGLSRLKKRRLRGGLIAPYSFLRKMEREVLSSSPWDQ